MQKRRTAIIIDGDMTQHYRESVKMLKIDWKNGSADDGTRNARKKIVITGDWDPKWDAVDRSQVRLRILRLRQHDLLHQIRRLLGVNRHRDRMIRKVQN